MENVRQTRSQFTTILETIRRPANQQVKNFALIVSTPAEIAEGLDDIRRRYDPAFKVAIPPHITIKRPAPLGEPTKLSGLRQLLRDQLKEMNAFPVQLEGYGIFKNPGSNVVFVKVQDEKPLCDLHNRVIRALSQLYPNGLADQYENDHYHPHLTIGNELSDLDLAVLEHELASGSYRLDYRFMVDAVTLFVQEADQPWQTVEVLRLAEGQS